MNIKEGMNVRISTNLQPTTDGYGISPEMNEMKGGIYNVKYYGGGDLVEVWDPVNKRTWMFCKCDVQPATETPPMKPVMFDPKSL